MIKRKYFVGVSCVLLLLLFSCSTTKLKSVWKDNTFDEYMTNIMVVAVAERLDIRKFFEKEFVKQFKEVGVEAMPSVEAIPSEDKLEADVILAEVRKHGIDIIMVTQLVSFEDESIDPTGESGGIFHTYYRNVSIYVFGPGYYDSGIQRTQSLTLVTKIYEAKTEKLIWSVTSKTLDHNLSEYNIVKSLSKVIINSLRDNKLLR
jgi:hypothetical protein